MCALLSFFPLSNSFERVSLLYSLSLCAFSVCVCLHYEPFHCDEKGILFSNEDRRREGDCIKSEKTPNEKCTFIREKSWLWRWCWKTSYCQCIARVIEFDSCLCLDALFFRRDAEPNECIFLHWCVYGKSVLNFAKPKWEKNAAIHRSAAFTESFESEQRISVSYIIIWKNKSSAISTFFNSPAHTFFEWISNMLACAFIAHLKKLNEVSKRSVFVGLTLATTKQATFRCFKENLYVHVCLCVGVDKLNPKVVWTLNKNPLQYMPQRVWSALINAYEMGKKRKRRHSPLKSLDIAFISQQVQHDMVYQHYSSIELFIIPSIKMDTKRE